MTDTRQVLEEAYEAFFGKSAQWHEWYGHGADSMRALRFRRLLNAEAWTDAALCLVPEGKCWHIRYDPRLTGATVMDQDGFNQHHTLAETPALALAQAALRAKEAGDV